MLGRGSCRAEESWVSVSIAKEPFGIFPPSPGGGLCPLPARLACRRSLTHSRHYHLLAAIRRKLSDAEFGFDTAIGVDDPHGSVRESDFVEWGALAGGRSDDAGDED